MIEAALGMWLGVLVVSAVMDTNDNMVVVVVVASELCDWLPWMEVLAKACLAFGFQKDGTIFYHVIYIVLMIHAI
jgi:hypothetical protein